MMTDSSGRISRMQASTWMPSMSGNRTSSTTTPIAGSRHRSSADSPSSGAAVSNAAVAEDFVDRFEKEDLVIDDQDSVAHLDS